MASPDPVVRSLAAKIAINSRIAGAPPRKPDLDRDVPDDLRDAYRREVDPDGALPLRQRQRRAAAAYRRDQAVDELDAYYAGLAADVTGPGAA